jgi:acetyl esterase/lipase
MQVGFAAKCRQIAPSLIDVVSIWIRLLMVKLFACCLVTGMAVLSARGLGDLVKVGLVDDTNPQTDSTADPCAGVSVTRGLKYGASEQNMLNVASSTDSGSAPRPVLLFVAGTSFANEATSADWAMRDQAICRAARNGMVGVAMSYRRAPADVWPAGAKDVAATASWIHQNIDLYGGDAREIIAVGYAVGAFHLASLLAHPELQNADSDIAGAVLISGIYKPDANADESERSYFGTDTSKYDDRSAFPGILEVDEPIVLAWSAADPPRLVKEAETLKERLCGAGHCPRIAELSDRDSPSSVFELDGSDTSLVKRTNQLISQIEARGLP